MWEQGLKPYVFSYGTLINALAKNGYMSDAFKLFDEMPERGVTPDVACYNILIDGFFKKGTLIHELCGSGNLDGAIRVYKAMFKGGVSPDVVVHNTMLNRDSQVGRIKECLELWKVDEAISIWELLPEKGCCTDSTTYGILIHGLCKNGYLNKALSSLKEAENGGFGYTKSSCCNAVINGFVRASKLEYAIRFFGGMVNNLVKEMLQKGWKPDTITYSLLMNGLCQGKLDMPLNFWFQALERRVSSQIISGAIGFLDEAVDRGVLPTAITWNILVREIQSPIIFTLEGLCSCYRISDAIGFLDEAVDHWVLPTAITWNILVRPVLDNRALT
ncbi:Pentatricopeptide repeat-containing protein [Vitis vinifera]|uniref:Pentatricopeptide repeat-containing protein n=1 Tax=Vitis vinifera TaxID=29760 RepID=A0A438JAN5_VITVI|nr:Pentatricopeptide repeat-containing protein [Vitis vinifera]